MQKVMTVIPRKPGTTRAQFKAYYENNHAPLGTRYFPFDKYCRNHLDGSIPADVGFDVLMESWLDREKAYAILTGEIVKIFDEDEARFMNAPPRPAGIDLVEHLVAGSPRGVDPRGTPKTAFLISNTGGADAKTFLRKATEWARAIGDKVHATRVILDEVIPGHESPLFRSDAIVTLWTGQRFATAPEPPAGARIDTVLSLDSQETPTEELRANFGKR